MAVLFACADNTLKKWDLISDQLYKIGEHALPIKDVANILLPQTSPSVVITGGYDAMVRFWSWQSLTQLHCVKEIYVAMPVHFMSCTWPLLVTAHQSRLIHVWDLEFCY